MELVIQKLTDIEIAAKQIMANANEEVKNRDLAMQEKKEAFDAQQEELTQERLENLRQKLQAENQENLLKLHADTEQTLKQLHLQFDCNHNTLSDAIVKRIIEV